MKNGERLMSGS